MYVMYKRDKQEISRQLHLRTLAKQMRRQPTISERKLWSALRNSQLGCKFRRQHPLFSYVVDFYCHQKRLIIEVDGPVHDQQVSYDQSRDKFFSTFGYRTLRFKNEEVDQCLDDVILRIGKTLSQVGEGDTSKASVG